MDDTVLVVSTQNLFHGLTITIIPIGISEARQQQLSDEFTAHGGVVIPFNDPQGRIDIIDNITHIVSTTTDFPDYRRVLDSLEKHVVKPAWIGDSIKFGKVKNPRSYSPDPALFMSEVVVCCGNIPVEDQDAIYGGVLALGGQYSITLSKVVTHLVVLDIGDPKAVVVIAKRLNCHIVLPHWFDDCLKVGRKISESPYSLPDPEILKISDLGIIPTVRTSQQICDASEPTPTTDPQPPAVSPHNDQSPRAIRAFNGKKVMLGEDLHLNERLNEIIIGMIKAGGGQIISNVDLADIYVCNFRDGPDYVKASQARKDVGNLSWLYYLIAYDTWTNPMRRLLHYPRPRHGIPGFEKYKISISSYTGEARIFLENLTKATGASFTKSLRPDNTHLIAAHGQSDKYEASKEWGVNVVNHLWLEESYAKCQEQALTNDRFTYFPPRTNLAEVLGQVEIDRKAVQKLFFPPLSKQVPGSAYVPGSSLPQLQMINNGGANSLLGDNPQRMKPPTSISTPATGRHWEKENQTPGTTGSRGAKDRALSKLHDSATDIAKFEKEMKRKGGVIHGGRREKPAEEEDKKKKPKSRDSIGNKRSFDTVDSDEHDEDTSDNASELSVTKRNKKAKKLGPIKYRMLLTKNDRWQDNPGAESKDKARLREIGIHIVEDPRNVDILCAPKVVRTKKFIAAMACGPALVATSFLDQALKHNKIPTLEKHLLIDPEFEKCHNVHMNDALVRAKQNKRHLLKGWQIYCTATGSTYDTYRDIITANGGQCNQWKGQANRFTASKRAVDSEDDFSQNQEEDEGDVLYLVSAPEKREVALWPKFRDLARKHDMMPRIASMEWLLHIAMAQKIHWDPKWELSEDML